MTGIGRRIQNMKLEELEHTQIDSRQNFVPDQPEPKPSSKPDKQNPDEISIQLNFRFVCSNSFKVLIGISFCLTLVWNVYLRSDNRCEPARSSPTEPPKAVPVYPTPKPGGI